MKYISILFSCLTVLLFISCLTNPVKVNDLTIDPDESIKSKVKKTEKWLQTLHDDNVFNGAVLLIKNDSVILKNTYGYTDASREKKLTEKSSFRLGSVSKQFTAAAIMLLKQQEKLDFEDSITKYLPELSYNKVTVRHLLQHVSGIPDVYLTLAEKNKEDVGDVLTIQEVVRLIAKENPEAKEDPNTEFIYSNTGYVLLAAIIERVSGDIFEDFMRKGLFEKLKMNTTRVWNLCSPRKDFATKTDSFKCDGDITIEVPPTFIDGVAGDGGVFACIDDFIIWNSFWYKNDLISDEIMEEAFKKPTLNNGEKSDYGFGWAITNENTAWHFGSWLGARTLIVRNKKLKNCMVILDNSSSISVNKMSEEMINVLE